MAHELEFTASSFLRIATIEARRGRDDPGQMFSSVNDVINELKVVHKQRREAYAKQSDQVKARELYGSFRPRIAELQRKKRTVLDAELHRVSKNLSAAIQDGGFSWALERGAIRKSRQTFRMGAGPIHYFPMKQLELNIKGTYQVIPPNRNRMISQLCDSLEGKLPRYVIRTDLASFYGSIPHTELLQELSSHGGLSKTSLRLIRLLLDEWKSLTGSEIGLPTGIGLSAYLGEVYAREIDRVLAGIPSVHFYGRYVDDIVLVVRTPEARDDIEARLRNCVSSLGLTLNAGKTQTHDPVVSAGNTTKNSFDLAGPIDFLGYAITKKEGAVSVEMSSTTIARYKDRLKASFARWAAVSSPTTGHDGLLLDRIRFLAGNTKLVNSKGRAVTGIYFNYPQLGAGAASLTKLDAELRQLLHSHVSKMRPQLFKRLDRVSFVRGHIERTYHRFRQSDLERLVAVWRD